MESTNTPDMTEAEVLDAAERFADRIVVVTVRPLDADGEPDYVSTVHLTGITRFTSSPGGCLDLIDPANPSVKVLQFTRNVVGLRPATVDEYTAAGYGF